jgi:hypothetical protein
MCDRDAHWQVHRDRLFEMMAVVFLEYDEIMQTLEFRKQLTTTPHGQDDHA